MAESSQQLRVVITAIDQASAKFHAINQSMGAMSAPLRQIGDRLGALAEVSGLRRIGEHARAAFGEIRHLSHGIFELAGALGGLAAGGAAVGIFEMIKSTAEFSEKLKFGALATGMPTEQLAGWHYAAKAFGSDAEQLDKGIQRLNRNIAMAAMGNAKDVERVLGRMGLHNTQKNMLGTATALEAINKEVTKLVAGGKPQLASAVLGTLMGSRSGMRMQPLFAQAELMKKVAEAAKYGIAPKQKQVDDAYEFSESLKHVAAAILGVQLAAGEELWPALTKINEELAKWIRLNREAIASKIGAAFRELSGWVRINWGPLKRGLVEVGGILKTVFVDTLGVQGTLITIGLMKFQPLIIALGAVGWAAVRAAAVMTAAFLTTPIGLGVALAAAGLLLATWFANQDWAKDWQILKDVGSSIARAWEAAIGAFGAWLTTWQTDASRNLVAAFAGAFDWINSHLPKSWTHEGESGHVDPETGGWVAGGRPALSTLPGAAYGTGGAMQKAEAHVTFSFKGLPDWLHPQVESSGGHWPNTNLGTAFDGGL